MKTICFPVAEDHGMKSTVYGHFGSAPAFVVVDADAGTHEVIVNADAHHEHGACSPLRALGGRKVDAVVVGGIGAGALNKLGMGGVKVFKADGGTVEENLAKLGAGALSAFTPMLVCRGHGGAGGACSH